MAAGFWLISTLSTTARTQFESRRSGPVWSRLASTHGGSIVVHGVQQGATARDLFGSDVLALLEKRSLAVFLHED
jgi:hypothetical protein